MKPFKINIEFKAHVDFAYQVKTLERVLWLKHNVCHIQSIQFTQEPFRKRHSRGCGSKQSGKARHREDPQVTLVANRPRFGCCSPARSRFSYTEVAESSAGQTPAERGGLRQRGRSNVYIDVLFLR
jgi:hypothetical protein